jgi:hypothetical protein
VILELRQSRPEPIRPVLHPSTFVERRILMLHARMQQLDGGSRYLRKGLAADPARAGTSSSSI